MQSSAVVALALLESVCAFQATVAAMRTVSCASAPAMFSEGDLGVLPPVAAGRQSNDEYDAAEKPGLFGRNGGARVRAKKSSCSSVVRLGVAVWLRVAVHTHFFVVTDAAPEAAPPDRCQGQGRRELGRRGETRCATAARAARSAACMAPRERIR